MKIIVWVLCTLFTHLSAQGLYPTLCPPYQYFNEEGKIVLSGPYQWVSDFQEGLAKVKLNDSFYFIDNEGKKVLGPYEEAYSFEQGVAQVRASGEEDSYYINHKGEKTQFKSSPPLHEGLRQHYDEKAKKFGYTNARGEQIIPCIYALAWRFSEGYAIVKKEAKDTVFYLIDTKGHLLLQLPHQPWGSITEGVIPMLVQQKLGFWKLDGTWAIPPSFEYKGNTQPCFSEGLCAIQEKNKFGYINKKGEWEIQPKYSFAYPFSQHSAWVRTEEGLYQLLDSIGKRLNTHDYLAYQFITKGLYLVLRTDYTYEFLNSKGLTFNLQTNFKAAPNSKAILVEKLVRLTLVEPKLPHHLHYAYFNFMGNKVWMCE